MGASLAMAIGLVLVLEGLMPFIAPAAWRDMMAKLLALADGQIRFIGCTLVVSGVALITLFG